MIPSSIVILTGAGISAESGVDTFRDKGGIWSKVDVREVATPEGFAANPQKVYDFYNSRRQRLKSIKPNPAHFAVAKLEAEHPANVLIVTQNVDSLHEQAGTENLIHMHGQHNSALCANCGQRNPWDDDIHLETICPSCKSMGYMRPDVVWFGEMPYQMERIYTALNSCDLFVSIGTSGNVYPAAQFVQEAGRAGAHTVELNLEPSMGISDFAEAIHGRAASIVPAYVEDLLKESRG